MPDVLEALPALLPFLAACVLIALSKAYDYSLGALLQTIGQAIVNFGVHLALGGGVFKDIGNAILSLDGAIRYSIGQGILFLEQDAATWFSWTAQANEAVGSAIAEVGEAAWLKIRGVVKVAIPGLIAAAVGPLIIAVHQLEQALSHVRTTTIEKIAGATTINRVFPVTIERVPGLAKLIEQKVHAAIAAIPVAVPIPHIPSLAPSLDAIKERLKSLESKLTLGALIGAGAYALSQLGLGGLRCSNAKKWNDGLCGTAPKVLEDLLLGLTAIFGTLSLVKLAEDYQKLIKDVSGEVQHFWRADVAGAGHDRALGQTGL